MRALEVTGELGCMPESAGKLKKMQSHGSPSDSQRHISMEHFLISSEDDSECILTSGEYNLHFGKQNKFKA